jgi:hypothetical protein
MTNAPNAQAMRVFIFHFFLVSMLAVGCAWKSLKNQARTPLWCPQVLAVD